MLLDRDEAGRGEPPAQPRHLVDIAGRRVQRHVEREEQADEWAAAVLVDPELLDRDDAAGYDRARRRDAQCRSIRGPVQVQHVREQRRAEALAGIDTCIRRDEPHPLAEAREVGACERQHLGHIDERRATRGDKCRARAAAEVAVRRASRPRVEECRGVRARAAAEVDERAVAEQWHQLARRVGPGDREVRVVLATRAICIERTIAADHLGQEAPARARDHRPRRHHADPHAATAAHEHAQRDEHVDERAQPRRCSAELRGQLRDRLRVDVDCRAPCGQREEPELVARGDRGVAQECAALGRRPSEDIHDLGYRRRVVTADLVLVCPGCRTASPGRIDVRTLERTGDILACECGRRYPIIDGVPVVMPQPFTQPVERELAPEVAALLVEGVPDDNAAARQLEHLSIYLDAHWGDRAAPPPEPAFGLAPIAERIAARAAAPVDLAVELGASVGRLIAELARGARRIAAVELQLASLRRARRLLAGERVAYARRMAGRHYAPAETTGTAITAELLLVCGDALDPPLLPGVFERVVAVNLLDSVARPRQLLRVVDGLCAPGGEVILASPYAWQSGVVDEGERIGGADPAADVAAILRDGTDLRARYHIEDEADLAWTLRRDARTVVTYRTHYLRARKRA